MVNKDEYLLLLLTLPVALISTSSGVEIPWKDKIRYLGAFVVQCRKFKCCLDDVILSCCFLTLFYGKLAELPRKKSTWKRCKCIPILLYGTEAFMLNRSDLSSLDFVITRLFMKLFRTNNIETVEFC